MTLSLNFAVVLGQCERGSSDSLVQDAQVGGFDSRDMCRLSIASWACTACSDMTAKSCRWTSAAHPTTCSCAALSSSAPGSSRKFARSSPRPVSCRVGCGRASGSTVAETTEISERARSQQHHSTNRRTHHSRLAALIVVVVITPDFRNVFTSTSTRLSEILDRILPIRAT